MDQRVKSPRSLALTQTSNARQMLAMQIVGIIFLENRSSSIGRPPYNSLRSFPACARSAFLCSCSLFHSSALQ